MTQALLSILAVITRKEREVKDAFHLFKMVEREIESFERLGRFIHPIKLEAWTQADARVTQLSNELQALYTERDATKVADAAAAEVRKQLALLNARGRRRQVA